VAIGAMAVAAFLYGYTAIALPSSLHSLVLPLVWLVLFIVACRWFSRRPRVVIALPALAILAWFAVTLSGR
jgi:MFS superfamily sulfate permease-like transporter